MMMTGAEFSAALSGEGDLVEFKEGVSAARTQDAVVAFSNADGGVVLYGVRDDGTICGVADVGEKQRLIHQAVAAVANPGRYDIHQVQVDDKTILALSVHRRREGFAQTPGGVVRIRRGASNPALMGTDLSRFMALRVFESFETMPTDVRLDSADGDLLQAVADAYHWPIDDEITDRLIETGLALRKDGGVVLSVAGALHLLDDPTRIGVRAFIDLRRFDDDSAEPNRTWRVVGSVAEQIERATASILDELGSTSVVIGVQRVEIPKLPPAVLREAIANAVAHRSYENAGSAVRVELRPDRVSIVSPGRLPEPVTIENLRVQQAARNEAVLDLLRRLGLAEDLGLGIDRMQDGMQAEMLQPPEFEEDDASFMVTLPLGGAVTPRERAWVRNLIDQGQLDSRSAPVLVHAAREGAVTNSDVRGLLGIDSVNARGILQNLVEAGIVEQRGERGGAQYVIASGLGVPARIRHSDEELDALVLGLARSGPVTNTLVREETGLDRVGALSVLQRLVRRGELAQKGTKRGTKYLPKEPTQED